MKESEVYAEIQLIIDDALSNRQSPAATWIAHQILVSHPCAEFDEAEFFILSAGKFVRGAVRHVLNRYKAADGETDAQILLPGFKRLQKAYSIDRDGEQRVVSIYDMTFAEQMKKADDLVTTSNGLLEHAVELRRFAKSSQVA